jgi:putative endonuclease
MPQRSFIPTDEWSDQRHRRGLDGERLALAYLTSCGWSVEAHRYRIGRHDIDLVVRRANLVAFVEVKTRRSSQFGQPEESVSAGKRRSLARAAEAWRQRCGRPNDDYRFDLVTVRLGAGPPVVEHQPDAWRLVR